MEALPTSFFAPSFSLKILFSADPWRGGQLRLSVHRPLFFSGVWAAAVIHGAACPRSRSLDLGLAVSRPWLNDVLSKVTQRLFRFAVSGLCGLVQGCYAPRNPVAPARSAPSGRSARRLLRSGEWGDLAAERLKGEKIPRFQDQGARSWIHGAVE